eukprot:6483718-Amphidinium_carterae.2
MNPRFTPRRWKQGERCGWRKRDGGRGGGRMVPNMMVTPRMEPLGRDQNTHSIFHAYIRIHIDVHMHARAGQHKGLSGGHPPRRCSEPQKLHCAIMLQQHMRPAQHGVKKLCVAWPC